MNTSIPALPQVNGVVLSYPQEGVTSEDLRQRACAELLRQAAIQAGLLAADDPLPLGGAMTEAASIRLQESVFDKLMSGEVEDLTADERNIYSLIIERARLGDQRGAKLAADLKLRDEQLAELRDERAKREASLRAAASALQKTTDKPKASPDEIRSQAVALIDEVMGIKPKAAAPASK